MGFTDDISDPSDNVPVAQPQALVPRVFDANRSIKISWNGEVRRVRYQIGVSKINDILTETFGIKNHARIVFTYSDVDDDTITLSTDLELCDLLTSFPDKSFRFEGMRKQLKLKNLNVLQEKEEKKQQQQQIEAQANANNNDKQKKKKQNKNKATNAPAAGKTIPEEKKAKKEKDAKKIREKIASWEKKIIRLRLSPGGEGVLPKFLGAKFNTKLVTNARLGIKGMWILHETKKGYLVLSPLNCPNRFLRVGEKGQVQLNQGGIGNRARWQMFSLATGDQITLSNLTRTDIVLVNKATGTRLAVVSLPNQKRPELVMVDSKTLQNEKGYSSSFFLGIVENSLRVIECLVGKLHEKRSQAKLNRKLRLGKPVEGKKQQGQRQLQGKKAIKKVPCSSTSSSAL